MMRSFWKKLACMLAVFALALFVVPELAADSALAAGTYGKANRDNVNVRMGASTDYGYWFRLPAGYVFAIHDTVKVSSKESWYKVTVTNPESPTGREYTGYIMTDYVTLLNASEAAQWEANPTQTCIAGPTTTLTSGAYCSGAMGSILSGGVNVREAASTGAHSMVKLDGGYVLELLAIPATIDNEHWFKVKYEGKTGYIMANYVKVLSYGNLIAEDNSETYPGSSKTPSPTRTPGTTGEVIVTATPTPVITETPAVTSVGDYGYVTLILNSANLRDAPDGKKVAEWVGKDSKLPVVSNPVSKAGYTWYQVNYNGQYLFVRGDIVKHSGSAVTEAPTAAPVTTTEAPAVTATPQPQAYGYVKTTVGNVNLRLKPGGEVITMVTKKGTVLSVLDDVVLYQGNNWYYVQYNNVKGYLRGDCVTLCDAAGNATAAPVITAAPTAAPVSDYGYVKTIVSGVNLRQRPADSSIEQLPLNSVLTVTGTTERNGKYDWYPVITKSGVKGWVRSDCVVGCDANGNLNGLITPTVAPGTETTTPAPTDYGHIYVSASAVNVRKTPGGNVVIQVSKTTVWPVIGAATTKDGHTWYPISVNGTEGWIRDDVCYPLTPEQESQYAQGLPVSPTAKATATPAPTAVYSNYVITVLDSVNLRTSPSKDSTAKANVKLGTVMQYTGTTISGGSTWYKVNYDGSTLWVQKSCIKVMTSAEYAEYIATNPTPAPTTTAVSYLGYVTTKMGGVNLRSKPSGESIAQLKRGETYPYTATVKSGSYTWYLIVVDANTSGYVRSDCVTVTTATATPAPTLEPGATPTPLPPVTPTPNKQSGQEATYTTLKLGSTGAGVKALVQELINQGYYTGSVTSTYTSAVRDAVIAFQTANNITPVDGIAGPNTQHALFGTVPEGQGSVNDLTMTLYKAEKIDWYTGGIQELLPKGCNFKVYDVYTGIVWWAHRWSGGLHADIEPLTAADTARLCTMYGVSKASEISSKNLWQRRPSLVTVGTRTFACSLYGIPHGTQTIKNNNCEGQICLHFTNSKTHGSQKVDGYHAAAIEYAWKNAPNGHK